MNHPNFYTAELKFLDHPSYSIKIYTTVDAHSVSIDYCCGDDRNYMVCYRIILKRNDDWYIDDFYHWSRIRNKDVIYSMIETSVNDFKIFKKGLLNHINHHVSKC